MKLLLQHNNNITKSLIPIGTGFELYYELKYAIVTNFNIHTPVITHGKISGLAENGLLI